MLRPAGTGQLCLLTRFLRPQPQDSQPVRFDHEFHGSVFLSRLSKTFFFHLNTICCFNILLQPLNCRKALVTVKCNREESAESFHSWVVWR